MGPLFLTIFCTIDAGNLVIWVWAHSSADCGTKGTGKGQPYTPRQREMLGSDCTQLGELGAASSKRKRSRQERAAEGSALLAMPSWQLLSGPTREIVEDGMAFMEEAIASEKRRALAEGKSVPVRPAGAHSVLAMEINPGEGFQGNGVGLAGVGDQALIQAHRMHGTAPTAPALCPTREMCTDRSHVANALPLCGQLMAPAGALSCVADVSFPLQGFLGGPAAMLPAPFFVMQHPYAPQAAMSSSPSMQPTPGQWPPGHRRTYLDEAAVVQIFLAKHSKPGVRDLNLSGRLAREYGVTAKAVRDIWTMRTWKSVTEPYRNQCANAAAAESEEESPQDVGEDD